MPVFYFNFWDHKAYVSDPKGIELSGLDAVRKRALDAAARSWTMVRRKEMIALDGNRHQGQHRPHCIDDAFLCRRPEKAPLAAVTGGTH
jgi:hypothetical protein